MLWDHQFRVKEQESGDFRWSKAMHNDDAERINSLIPSGNAWTEEDLFQPQQKV